VTSLMKELFNACSNGTDKLDVNQFSVLLTQYEGSITPQQVAISFDSLSDEQGLVTQTQFIAWAAAMFSLWWGADGQPEGMLIEGMEELISIANNTPLKSAEMPHVTPSAVVRMAGPLLALATAGEICSALQSEPSRETKVAAVVRALGGTDTAQPTAQQSPQTASYVPLGGSIQLDRPCMNMCQKEAQLFLPGLRAPICKQCAGQLAQFPIMQRAGSSLAIPRAVPSGTAAIVATALDEMSAAELHALLGREEQLLSKFRSAMLQLVLPSLLPKPVTMSAEMFKLSTNQTWFLRRFELDQDKLAYYDGDKECRVFELRRITAVRQLRLSIDAAAEGDKDFQFAVYVSPVDKPATEQVFRANTAEEQLAWLKAIHCNVCLIPANERAMPELMPCSI